VPTETPGTTTEAAAEEDSSEEVPTTAAAVEETSLALAQDLATTLAAEVSGNSPRFLLWRWQWW